MKSMRILLIMIVAWASASLAEAHAFLDHAEPKVGSTVAAPTEVKLWMTMGLRKASTLQVLDASGKEVDGKDVRVNEETMAVSVPRLGAGTYTVEWKAVASCGHKTSGTFVFVVK